MKRIQNGHRRSGADETGRSKRHVRTFTATAQDLEMLETVARYHGFSKSGTITSLIRREFWRLFPAGTRGIRPERGARVTGRGYGG